jgi:hypothetical protein
MKPIIPYLVRQMADRYKADAISKGQRNAAMEQKLAFHKKFEQLRADWAEKRVNSIFREVERYGVVIKGASDSMTWRQVNIQAVYQNVEMVGHLTYTQMDTLKPFKAWRRPKIEATFWILDSQGQRCYLSGHQKSALKVVFGEKRMMTYNRLMPAMLNAMAR